MRSKAGRTGIAVCVHVRKRERMSLACLFHTYFPHQQFLDPFLEQAKRTPVHLCCWRPPGLKMTWYQRGGRWGEVKFLLV